MTKERSAFPSGAGADFRAELRGTMHAGHVSPAGAYVTYSH
ncbi:hypothetical protein [Streptomyces pacificus]|nr:hypothetical protein [Streptomyces pacificus]